MLTVEQVKTHSEVSIGNGGYNKPYTSSLARLLYFHNEHRSKLWIMCELPNPIYDYEVEIVTEVAIKSTIDWDRFTDWINRHDDLSEEHLMTPKQWVDIKGKRGRNGLLNTITNKVIDCNKVILV